MALQDFSLSLTMNLVSFHWEEFLLAWLEVTLEIRSRVGAIIFLNVVFLQLKEFLLDQTEAYEVKIGDRAFRRPGDPSLDEIVEKLHAEEQGPDDISDEEDDQGWKEEL